MNTEASGAEPETGVNGEIGLPTKDAGVQGLFLLFSASKPCLTMPLAKMLPTSLEATRPALALGPTSETRRSMMEVPAQRKMNNLILPSMTMYKALRYPPTGCRRNPSPRRARPKPRTFYLVPLLLLTDNGKLVKP